MLLFVVNIKKKKIKDYQIPQNFIKNKYSVYEYQLIKEVLNNYYNIKEFKINYTKNGKPYLENLNIFLSISHDNDLLAICFDNKEVGIDLQFYNKESLKIKNFLNISEKKDAKEIIEFFSKKEAIIKLKGLALKDINNINLEEYDIHTFFYKDYVLNIAHF